MLSRFTTDAAEWARITFGGSTLPDERLIDRLVSYAHAQALDPAGSTAAVTGDDRSAREGAYRFLENPRVEPTDIEQGPFEHTAELSEAVSRLLLVQDTSSVAVASHQLRDELISAGSPTGFLAHTCLAVDGTTGEAIGLLDQQRWVRDPSSKTQKGRREYAEKESAKWVISDMAARGRLGDSNNCVTVCDREADIYEFLLHHIDRNQRFVVRACADRRIQQHTTCQKVFEAVRSAPVRGHRVIRIEQRGGQRDTATQKGRPARKRQEAKTQIQACHVTLSEPAGRRVPGGRPLAVNVVRVAGVDGLLEWILLTTEPIDTLADVEQIVRDYERRWVIEEFHKWWKTGCRLESRPLQSLDAVERMMTITAPIAMRLMHLHNAARSDEVDKSAAPNLSAEELRCLWAITERKPFPTHVPTATWAYYAVARLGGFYDSKKTGRVGCQSLWKGWLRFQERFAGWTAARAAAAGAQM